MNLFEAKHHEWHLSVIAGFMLGIQWEYDSVLVMLGSVCIHLEWW